MALVGLAWAGFLVKLLVAAELSPPGGLLPFVCDLPPLRRPLVGWLLEPIDTYYTLYNIYKAPGINDAKMHLHPYALPLSSCYTHT